MSKNSHKGKKNRKTKSKNTNNSTTTVTTPTASPSMATSSSTPDPLSTGNRFGAISDDLNDSLDSFNQPPANSSRAKGLELLGQMRGHDEEAKKKILDEMAKTLGVEHLLKDGPGRPVTNAGVSAADRRDRSVSRKRKGDEDAGGGKHKQPRQISPTNSSGRVENVFLSGVSDNVKKNGITFRKEFSKALPQVNLTKVSFTRSGSVILFPSAPEDFSRLIKEDWSKHVSLGSNIKASTDKGKKVEYKAVITGVDPTVDDDELKLEIEDRNNLKVTDLVRFLNKGTQTKTWRVLICLENEETQKRVLRNGIFLGLELRRCEPAYEKSRDGSAENCPSQCFRCQKWNPNHSSGQCSEKRACLWCAEEHPHKDCPHFQSRDKGKAKCANCNEAHPAWTKTCRAFLSASQSLAKPSTAKIVGSASVSRTDLDARVEMAMGAIWEPLVMIIATVVSKAVLDLNEDLKKGKVDQWGLALNATKNTVRAVKEYGLLDPSRLKEVTGVQQSVWKDVFPQIPFPHSSQAGSATPGNSNSSSQSVQ